jgi:RHS repeat-associated protein
LIVKVNKNNTRNSLPLYHKSLPLYRRRPNNRRKNILPGESGKFSSKEQDPETGFYYYGARYLDPRTSRWLSGDPAMGEYIPVAPINDEAKKNNQNLPGQGGVFNLVNLHVYHYAGNNPVKYTDPDGKVINLVAAGIGAAIGAGISAGMTALNGGSARDIAAAAVGGAVAGGMAGLTMGGSVVVGLAGGALASMAGYTASNMVSGDATTVKGLVVSGASGAAGYAGGRLIGAGLTKINEIVMQGKISFTLGDHIGPNMEKKGWTVEKIESTLNNPSKTRNVMDTRHLSNGTRLNEPATAYINEDGSYVVRNNQTGDIVQISNRNNPNFKQPDSWTQ